MASLLCPLWPCSTRTMPFGKEKAFQGESGVHSWNTGNGNSAAWLAQASFPTIIRARPMQTWRGMRVTKLLRCRSTDRPLKGLSRREGVTLFMTLLAAFNIMVSRYTGQKM